MMYVLMKAGRCTFPFSIVLYLYELDQLCSSVDVT